MKELGFGLEPQDLLWGYLSGLVGRVLLWLSWREAAGWWLTPPLFSVEGISVKMFLRGRPITMYIPSGIRSLEELPSGPPPETLSLDWVYPAPPSPWEPFFPSWDAPAFFFMVSSWVCRDRELRILPCYPLPMVLPARSSVLPFSSPHP